MKIPLLNKKLVHEKTTPVVFAFPPVALPISKQGELTAEDEADTVYYSTFVYDVNDEQFAVFEFDQDVMDGLLAYRARHGSLLTLEVLLSREEDGKLRMTTGNPNVRPALIAQNQKEEFQQYHEKLFDRYMSKIGRTMYEYAQV